MADQPARQPFRFRIPWITTTTAPPAPRPPAATQAPTSSRPPFRPPGVAPPRSTTTSFQAQPRNESRPPSPAKIIPSQSRPSSSPIRTAPQPRVVSQPPSPSNSGQTTPQATFQPPARSGSQPPSPSPISPKPQLPPSPPPTPSKLQQADETSLNPTSLSRASTQQEAETQKSTISQLIKSSNSQPPQPSRSSKPPPSTVATTSEPPTPQNLQPEMNIPKPQDKIKEETPIAQSQQEENAPTPVVDERNQASQLELQGKVSDSNVEVLASEDEEKNLKKAAHTNVHPVPHKEIRNNISKFTQRISNHPENITDENSVSVITLTGENTGATMKLGSESERNESKIHVHRGYKLSQEDMSEATTDGENNPKRKSKGTLGFMWLSIIIIRIQ